MAECEVWGDSTQGMLHSLQPGVRDGAHYLLSLRSNTGQASSGPAAAAIEPLDL